MRRPVPTRKAIVVYLMASSQVVDQAEAAVRGGADMIELGIPFSDPLADGPVIRQAAEAALGEGMTTARALELVRELRQRVDVPIVPMTYAALLEAYGWRRFDEELEAAGGDSMIVADLPVDVYPELRRIQLVAPTSTDERIRLGAEASDGWLYLVTLTGTTGARADLSPQLPPLVERTRRVTDLPLYAGFGISTPQHAAAACALCDGVVVGSRALQVAQDGPDALADFVATLREAVDAV